MASIASDPAMTSLRPFAEQAAAHWCEEQNYPALHAVITLLRREDFMKAAYEIAHEAPARSMHAAVLSARKFLLACLNTGPFSCDEWRLVLKAKGLVWTGLRHSVLPRGLSVSDCDIRHVPPRYHGLIDRAITLASEERSGGRKNGLGVDSSEVPYMIWHLDERDPKRKQCRLNAMSVQCGAHHTALIESARAKLVRLSRSMHDDVPSELFRAVEGEKIVVHPRRQAAKKLGRRSSKRDVKAKPIPAVGAFLNEYGLSTH